MRRRYLLLLSMLLSLGVVLAQTDRAGLDRSREGDASRVRRRAPGGATDANPIPPRLTGGFPITCSL
jgi:hypothetical protein